MNFVYTSLSVAVLSSISLYKHSFMPQIGIRELRGKKHLLLTKYVLRNKFDFTYMLETELPVLSVVYRGKWESGGKKRSYMCAEYFLVSFFG